MRLIILIHFLTINVCLCQFSILQNTGIIANKNEPTYGLWLNFSKEKDGDIPGLISRTLMSFSIDYYLKSGFEIGASFHNNARGGNEKVKQKNISYHFKNGYKKNYVIHHSIAKKERENYDRPDDLYTHKKTAFKWYNDNKFFIEIGKIDYKNIKYKIENNFNFVDYSISILKSKASYNLITIGKYERIGNSFVIGGFYTRQFKHKISKYRLNNQLIRKPEEHDIDLIGIMMGFIF